MEKGLKLVGDYEGTPQDLYLGAIDANRSGNPAVHLFILDGNKRQEYIGCQFSNWNSGNRQYLSMNGMEKVARVISNAHRPESPVRLSYTPPQSPTKEDLLSLTSGKSLAVFRGLDVSEINELRMHQGLPTLNLAA